MPAIQEIPEMQAWSHRVRRGGERIVLVPTMGFLHEGHLSLVRAGRRHGDRLVVSIFANPTQFAPSEDFESYPRDLERDVRLLAAEGVDLLFNPTAEAMYPRGFQTYVDVEAVSRPLCGAHRPGHFRGVATVVLKLFNIVRPHVAVFGLKDYQQVQVIRHMLLDLNLDVEVVACPTVREPDGLAMSSRNRYLEAAERQAAACLQGALGKAQALVRGGETSAAKVRDAVVAEIGRQPLARLEYADLCDPDDLDPVSEVRGPTLLALCAWVGKARLIDNRILEGRQP
ncbi:MAG: pantoate--beta-alanine ligase [Deltaproteobacteria bacterium]|nr:pantoate--beta-alanine ligase [Deltaproteobacteria bacterium]